MLSANTLVKRFEDHRFKDDESDVSYSNHLFIRLTAKDRTFTKVSFKYCTFDACYIRSCKFLNCDFTGSRFVSTSFHGSSFSHCEFGYATFEKTQIASDILETQSPTFENLKAKFARSLRTNYQQLGDTEAANKAIKVELQATRTHLHEAWHSENDYYREKYPGWNRIGAFFKWLWFVTLHYMWGNGESVLRLFVALLLLFFVMGIYHGNRVGAGGQISAYVDGMRVAPEVYLGIRTFPQYGYWYLAAVTATRLLSFAALTSIIIKRFSRR